MEITATTTITMSNPNSIIFLTVNSLWLDYNFSYFDDQCNCMHLFL